MLHRGVIMAHAKREVALNPCPLPLGIETALAAFEVQKTQGVERRSQTELALKQARYEPSLV